METEEIIKLVDGIYKNILDKFNPGARQLISAGKAYLKALHGASAASNLFNEALAKIAVNAQQGGTIDIGSALMNIVGVYKEIQDQHMNILKAFYVDLLVPLETNLEKDTKVVQFEQKKFLQQHKLRSDSYGKAATTMKKYRKKNSKSSAKDAEKEIKSIQMFEEEKHKLDQFCEYSLKNAMTQERRRYGFVLERQCSLAKHWMAYHHSGHLIIEKSLENWNDVPATREFLPPNVENMFTTKQLKDMDDEDDDAQSIASQLRKTRSIDASCLDMRSLGDVMNSSMMQMPRAKSEFNLNNSSATSVSTLVGVGVPGGHMMSATLKSTDTAAWDRPTVKALYAYLSSGENQLSFLEGDRIALVGDRAKGWQFGENLRTQKFGWFPIAYAENERDNDKDSISEWVKAPPSEIEVENTPDSSLESTLVDDSLSKGPYPPEEVSPTRMFGDTIQYRQSKQFRRLSRGDKPPKPGPPPQLPAPVPTPVVPNYSKPQGIPQSNSFSSSGGAPMVEKRKTPSATINFNKPQSSSSKPKTSRNGIASASLHSSNDSGFSNEPQPQPEVEMYSDEEAVSRVPIRSARSEKNLASRTTERDLSEHRSPPPHYRYNSRGGGGDPMMVPDDDDDIYGTIVPPHRQRPHMRQANSFGNIAESNSGTLEYGYRSRTRMSEGGHPNGGPNQSDSQKIKRTKSFWKFSKSQDHIMEGMAMWKHNDIIPTGREKREMEKKEATLKRNMRKKEQLEKQKQKEMMVVKEAEEARKKQELQMQRSVESSTLMRNRERERERDRDRMEREPRERPHSIAMMPEQEKFPITKSDIDKRISKLDEMQQHQHQQQQQQQQQQKKVSQPRQERQERQDRQERQERHERQDRQDRQERTDRHERQDRQDRQERVERQERHERDRRHEESERKPSKSNKQDGNNNRNSYANRLEQEEIYGEAMQPMPKGKDKYRTSERESSKNRNNDALNKYYQDQHFDDFAIIPSDSIMIQDTSFYDDDGMMDDDMMLMKTVRRKEILKQYYSSGTDTERNSSSSDPYDCIVVDDHLVSAADMMMRKNRGDKSRKSNGEASNNRMEPTPKQEEKMTFSTFRGTAVDEDEAMMMLEDEMMDDPPRDRRSKLSKANSANPIMDSMKYESEQESRISAKVNNNGNQKRKSTKSTASDGKAYGPWYDLWGAESTMQSQK